jgi:hypothetical protein
MPRFETRKCEKVRNLLTGSDWSVADADFSRRQTGKGNGKRNIPYFAPAEPAVADVYCTLPATMV